MTDDEIREEIYNKTPGFSAILLLWITALWVTALTYIASISDYRLDRIETTLKLPPVADEGCAR